MIYFTLPNFYDNFYINNFFITLSKANPEYFKEKITFIQTSGNFPYCSWNGGMNNCYDRGAFYDDFSNCYRMSSVPLRFNCANVLLEDFDFDNTMANLILELNENGSNLIEVANLKLMDYLETQFPNYKFVFSKQADLMQSFTPDLLNSILDLDKFYLIGIPDRFNNNEEFLKTINKKTRLELTVNPPCPKHCKKNMECLLSEHANQLSFSSQFNIANCKKSSPYTPNNLFISLEDIKTKYLPLGITHYIFTTQSFTDAINSFIFYNQYFIKPEYQLEVQKMWESGGNNNG